MRTIAVLAYLGPRRRAAAEVRQRDVDLKRGTMRFQGKGGKVVVKPMPDELVAILRAAWESRHRTALMLVRAGELDEALALSYVVWPRRGSRLEDEHVPLGRQFWPFELRDEIRHRHAQGETIQALACSTGVSFGTVKAMVSSAERCKDAERERALF